MKIDCFIFELRIASVKNYTLVRKQQQQDLNVQK